MSSLNIEASHAPIGANEALRQYELDQYKILDTPPEREFDDLAQLASLICQTPVSAVTLIDHDRQWFKAVVGLEITEISRDLSFCAHTIQSDDLMVVQDMSMDSRFQANEYVTGDPNVRFYAGAPLINPNGYALGSLCVLDTKPRELTDAQRDALSTLGRMAASMMEYHRTRREFIDAVTDRDEIWAYFESFAETVSVEQHKAGYPSAGLVGASAVAGALIGYALGSGGQSKKSE